METQPASHISYRQILKEELLSRIARNPRYSLRAMARETGLSPALLSSVINGKKGLSVDSGFRVCKALKFTKKKTEYFAILLQLDSARSEELKSSLQDKLNDIEPQRPVHNLSVDHFRLISEWYHFAILELATLPSFTISATAISTSLGISKLEAESALERLTRLGLLVLKSGKYQKVDVMVTSVAPSEALRKYHAQMLQKAQESLTTQSTKEKVVGSETFAFSETDIPAAAKIIDDCFDKLVALSKRGKSNKSIYHTGIQLFRLTKKDS